MSKDKECLFCQVVLGEVDAAMVYEDEISIAFLDHRPLFHGHTLLVPKEHVETLVELPKNRVGPFFQNVQLLSAAVKEAMKAEGTFVAMNNTVSQSVPHLHVHIVPRKKKDGLKGFFWPRYKYESNEDLGAVQQLIVAAIKKFQ